MGIRKALVRSAPADEPRRSEAYRNPATLLIDFFEWRYNRLAMGN